MIAQGRSARLARVDHAAGSCVSPTVAWLTFRCFQSGRIHGDDALCRQVSHDCIDPSAKPRYNSDRRDRPDSSLGGDDPPLPRPRQAGFVAWPLGLCVAFLCTVAVTGRCLSIYVVTDGREHGHVSIRTSDEEIGKFRVSSSDEQSSIPNFSINEKLSVMFPDFLDLRLGERFTRAHRLSVFNFRENRKVAGKLFFDLWKFVAVEHRVLCKTNVAAIAHSISRTVAEILKYDGDRYLSSDGDVSGKFASSEEISPYAGPASYKREPENERLQEPDSKQSRREQRQRIVAACLLCIAASLIGLAVWLCWSDQYLSGLPLLLVGFFMIEVAFITARYGWPWTGYPAFCWTWISGA